MFTDRNEDFLSTIYIFFWSTEQQNIQLTIFQWPFLTMFCSLELLTVTPYLKYALRGKGTVVFLQSETSCEDTRSPYALLL